MLSFFLFRDFVLFETEYQTAHQGDSKMPNGKALNQALVDKRGDTTGTYQLLMQVFAPAVVTKGTMTDGIMTGLCWSNIVSISDEAFVILGLINAWNTWVPEDLKITDDKWPQDTPAYSTCGQGKTAAKFNGWSLAGVKRYAEIFQQVRHNRSDLDACLDFDEKMEKVIVEQLSDKNRKKMNRHNGANEDVSNGPAESFLSEVADTIADGMW